MIPVEPTSSQLVKLAAAIFDVEPTDFLLLDDSQEIPQRMAIEAGPIRRG
ncbi:hypothetical protein [Corynebacterium mayonis]